MKAGAGMPRSVLLALTAFVLLAHAWLLRATPPPIHASAAPRVAAFVTRRIEAPAPVTQAAPVAPPAQPVRRAPVAPPARVATLRPAGQEPAGTQPRPALVDPPDQQPVRVEPPPSMQLRYLVSARVKGSEVQGTSELLWRPDGTHYEASFEVALTSGAARRQHSAGELSAVGLEPRRFAEKSRGEQAAHFERDAGRVSFSNNRPPAPLLPGAQDRLSVLLQLAALFAGQPDRYPVGASIAIQTATTSEAGNWVFTVEAQERLRLPMAEMSTVKLVRPPRGEYDQRMEVWLAPGAAYVPARLRLTQPNGDWVDHQWSDTDRR